MYQQVDYSTNVFILGIYMNLVKTTGMWKNLQGVSQGDDENEDKKVISVCDPKKASRK